MTNPSITYGHGVCIDQKSGTWSEYPTGIDAADCALTGIYNNDVFKIEGKCDDSGNERVYYAYTLPTPLSVDTYPYFVVRYKTSESALGLGAWIQVVFDDASYEYLLASVTTPLFSTEWNVASGSLTTTGKTITKIHLAADDYPDSVDSGTDYVYYDFVLLCKGTFTLPNVGYGLEFTPPPRYATIPIPSRVGDVTQNLGSELATVTASCNLDIGDWKRTGDYVDGEVFYDISHNTSSEPWQWLDTGSEQFKATLENPVFRRSTSGNKTQHILDLLFRECRLSDASNESYVERFGLNL